MRVPFDLQIFVAQVRRLFLLHCKKDFFYEIHIAFHRRALLRPGRPNLLWFLAQSVFLIMPPDTFILGAQIPSAVLTKINSLFPAILTLAQFVWSWLQNVT